MKNVISIKKQKWMPDVMIPDVLTMKSPKSLQLLILPATYS